MPHKRSLSLFSHSCYLLLLCSTFFSGCSNPENPKKTDATTSQINSTDEEAEEVLDRLRKTYLKAESYADNSVVVEHSRDRALGRDVELIYQQLSVAYVRPNKIKVDYATVAATEDQATVYKVASNGKIIRSTAGEVPLQIHETLAPEILTRENIIPEPLMRSDMLEVSLENLYPQLILLLEDSEQPIFPQDSKPRLLADEEIDGKAYYRVQLLSPAGKRVLWIDKDEYFLRRMELPIDSQMEQLDPSNRTVGLKIWIDFLNISFDVGIDEDSFEISIPKDGRRVRRFLQPPPAAPESDDEKVLAEHKKIVEQYEQALDSATIKDSILEVEIIEPEVPARKLPENFMAKELWQLNNKDISKPGHITLAGEQLLILDGNSAIVCLNAETGEIMNRLPLPAEQEQGPGFLRTLPDKSNKDWILASGSGWQQVYLFDPTGELILKFPEERHSGIGDVQITKIAEDDKPTMFVGYWGGLGIQGIASAGRRLWANRTLDHVIQLSPGPKDAAGNPTFWATSLRGTVMQFSSQGRTLNELYVSGQALMNVTFNSNQDSHAGLAVKDVGQYQAVGFNAEGKVLWEHALPEGEYTTQVPRVLQVPVEGGGTGWLVVASNGSIHYLDSEGELLDRFNYGEILNGIALVEENDRILLYLSSDQGLTAWALSQK